MVGCAGAAARAGAVRAAPPPPRRRRCRARSRARFAGERALRGRVAARAVRVRAGGRGGQRRCFAECRSTLRFAVRCATGASGSGRDVAPRRRLRFLCAGNFCSRGGRRAALAHDVIESSQARLNAPDPSHGFYRSSRRAGRGSPSPWRRSPTLDAAPAGSARASAFSRAVQRRRPCCVADADASLGAALTPAIAVAEHPRRRFRRRPRRHPHSRKRMASASQRSRAAQGGPLRAWAWRTLSRPRSSGPSARRAELGSRSEREAGVASARARGRMERRVEVEGEPGKEGSVELAWQGVPGAQAEEARSVGRDRDSAGEHRLARRQKAACATQLAPCELSTAERLPWAQRRLCFCSVAVNQPTAPTRRRNWSGSAASATKRFEWL